MVFGDACGLQREVGRHEGGLQVIGLAFDREHIDDYHICHRYQGAKHISTLGLGEIDNHAFFVAIQTQIQRAFPVHERRVPWLSTNRPVVVRF